MLKGTRRITTDRHRLAFEMLSFAGMEKDLLYRLHDLSSFRRVLILEYSVIVDWPVQWVKTRAVCLRMIPPAPCSRSTNSIDFAKSMFSTCVTNRWLWYISLWDKTRLGKFRDKLSICIFLVWLISLRKQDFHHVAYRLVSLSRRCEKVVRLFLFVFWTTEIARLFDGSLVLPVRSTCSEQANVSEEQHCLFIYFLWIPEISLSWHSIIR